MRSEKHGALLVLIVLVLSAVLGGIYGPSVKATAAGVTDLQQSVKTFSQVLTIVQQNYAVPVDTDKLVYDGAIPEMLRMLDPHSYFFIPHVGHHTGRRGRQVLRRWHDDCAAHQ